LSIFPSEAVIKAQNMSLEWSDLNVILAICRSGTLSGAARMLGQNHSTIFRRINNIEERTGVRFFERLRDGYAMTDAGRSAMRYAERIEAEVHALGREVLGQDLRIQGKIRVTAPEGMLGRTLPPRFAEFRRQHPDVSIEILGGHFAVDLNKRESDIAIRATSKPPDTSLGKKLCNFRFGIYASPEFLKKVDDRPIQEQPWCFIEGVHEWLVPMIWKKAAHAERVVAFSSTSVFGVLNCAAEGMGLTFMPCYLADADPRLVRVADLLESLTLELWILTHPDLRHTARVKALMAFLFDELGKDCDLFEGKRPVTKPKAKFMF
jgi:DNA-binding transcriptional LysR family regulator